MERKGPRDGSMVKELANLAEGQSSIPNTYAQWLTTAYSSCSRRSDFL